MSGSARVKATHVYLGQGKCGCYFSVVTDDGDKFTASTVADMIRRGLTVTRVTFPEYRGTNFGAPCPHRPAKPNPDTQKPLFPEAPK